MEVIEGANKGGWQKSLEKKDGMRDQVQRGDKERGRKLIYSRTQTNRTVYSTKRGRKSKQ